MVCEVWLWVCTGNYQTCFYLYFVTSPKHTPEYTQIHTCTHAHVHTHSCAHTLRHTSAHTDTHFLLHGFANKGSAIRLSYHSLLVLWANNYFFFYFAKQNHPHCKLPPFKSIIGAVTELRPIRLFNAPTLGKPSYKCIIISKPSPSSAGEVFNYGTSCQSGPMLGVRVRVQFQRKWADLSWSPWFIIYI
jgi:hypothetical protein